MEELYQNNHYRVYNKLHK